MSSDVERSSPRPNRLLDGDDPGVIAIFANEADRTRAATALREAGFPGEAIVLISARDTMGDVPSGQTPVQRGRLVVGGAMGAAGAILLESSVLAFPAGAPLPAGGTLAAAVIGASVGATAGAISAASDEGARQTRQELARNLSGGKLPLGIAAAEPLLRERARRICRQSGALETFAASPDLDRVHFVRGFAEFVPALREHWERHYASRGEGFEKYEPRYRFGWQRAGRPDFKGRSWAESERELRADWERRFHEVSWDEAVEAVKQGWLAGGGRG